MEAYREATEKTQKDDEERQLMKRDIDIKKLARLIHEMFDCRCVAFDDGSNFGEDGSIVVYVSDGEIMWDCILDSWSNYNASFFIPIEPIDFTGYYTSESYIDYTVCLFDFGKEETEKTAKSRKQKPLGDYTLKEVVENCKEGCVDCKFLGLFIPPNIYKCKIDHPMGWLGDLIEEDKI